MTTVLCPQHASSVLHAGGLEVFAGSLLTECWTEGSTLSLLSSEASFFWVGGFGGLPLPHIQTPPRSWSTFRASRSNCPLAVAENGPQLPPWAWQRSLTLSGRHRGICLGPIVSALCLHFPNIGVRVKVILKTT